MDVSKEDMPKYSLWKSKMVMYEMLGDRGYIVPTGRETFPEFLEKYRDNLRDSMTKIFERGTSKIIVFWCKILSVSVLGAIEKKITTEGIHRCIIVAQSKITPVTKGSRMDLKNLGYIVETFFEYELLYNVSHHASVPRHIICGEEKKKQILTQYGATDKQIPQIKRTDPMARYLGVVRNQLLKIVRIYENIKIGDVTKQLVYVTYRIVV